MSDDQTAMDRVMRKVLRDYGVSPASVPPQILPNVRHMALDLWALNLTVNSLRT